VRLVAELEAFRAVAVIRTRLVDTQLFTLIISTLHTLVHVCTDSVDSRLRPLAAQQTPPLAAQQTPPLAAQQTESD